MPECLTDAAGGSCCRPLGVRNNSIASSMILAIEFHGISNVSSGEACVAEIGGRSEALVDQYVAEGKTAEAVAMLFDLIVESAKKKDFIKAEALRNKTVRCGLIRAHADRESRGNH